MVELVYTQHSKCCGASLEGSSPSFGTMSTIKELTQKVEEIISRYKKEYPNVQMDRDYFAHKITEEWGECLKEYLMLTDRGRQKGFSKEEIKEHFMEEIADVFGYILAFASNEDIDLEKALEKKWFKYLKKENS